MHRALIAVLQPAGDDADDAGMPAFRRQHQYMRIARGLFLRQRNCLGQHVGLQRAALFVQRVELARQFQRQRRIVGREQPRAEIGASDAAAGIHARPQQEAAMESLQPLVHPRHVAQHLEADIAALAHHLQPLRRQRAVEAAQRHHIADGAERDEVEPLQQIRLRPRRRVPAGAAQRAIERHHQQIGDADRRQIAMRETLVEPVGIDDGMRRVQRGNRGDAPSRGGGAAGSGSTAVPSTSYC